MTEMSAQQLGDMINATSLAITQSVDELNRLDSALGDGDHGTSLSVAFADAAEKIRALERPAPSDILRVTGQSLMNRMGGASGALYGTLFMRASGAVRDKPVLTHDDLKAMWYAAVEGVKQRGKAQPGDKTMIDALQPAAEAFGAERSVAESFERAAAAAETGAEKTKGMIAKHGRAKFAHERSLGHMDAGARSITVMFKAMNACWKESQNG